MNHLEIRLLNGFQLQDGSAAVTGLSDRQQMLLAYLLLNSDQPQPRQQVAFRFWPASSDKQAMTNLRQLLFHLRQSWKEVTKYLVVTPQALQWKLSASCHVDVHEFETLIRQARSAQSIAESIHLLEKAVACYTGDLLPNCYDDWVDPLRDQLRRQYVYGMETLIRSCEALGEYQAAISWAERYVQHDPLREETYRALMQLYTLTDNRTGALRAYHTCEKVLKEELEVRPDPATREQYRRLLEAGPPTGPRSDHPTVFPAAAGTPPILGRVAEWARLRSVWETVRSGRAQIVLIFGEAGIGKTRLLEELARWATLQEAVTAEARTYAAQGQLTYAPVSTWLRSEPLRHKLAHLDSVWLSEVSRLLPELKADNPDLPAPQPISESWQRERMYEALARAVISTSDRRPVVLMLDDVQWCGEGVLEWLSYLLHYAASAPLLIAGTVRSGTVDADHPLQTWVTSLRQEQILTEVRLHPLGPEDSAQLAAQIAGRQLQPEQAAALYLETEGNPFFIVETMRAAGERVGHTQARHEGPQGIAGISLPPKVQAVVESRLSQLSPAARMLAEHAAAIGREFAFDVLAQATHWDEEEVVRSLDELWQRHIIREQGKTAYDFSHDKIREVVYSHISQARRRLLHRRIAEALLAAQSDDSFSVSAQLAHHYEQALMPEQAIACYREAAAGAQRVYANAEVVDLLTKALALFEMLPPSVERDNLELTLRVARSAPLVALASYSSPAVVAEYRQVLALCQRLNLPPDPRALRGLALANILQAEFLQTSAHGQQIIDLVTSEQDAVLLVEGHYVLGVSAFWRGEFAQSHHHLEQALAHYSPAKRATHISAYAQDPQVVCLTRLAWTLWHMGYPDQAYTLMARATGSSGDNPHPFSQAYALAFSCMMYEDAEDHVRLQEQAEQLERLTTEANFFYLRSWAAFHQGWIVGLQGNYAESARRIRKVIDDWHAEQTYLLTPRMLERLAVAYARVDRLDEAAATLDEALCAAVQRGETYFLAELIRMKGEFLLAQGGAAEDVAVHYRDAAALAARQGSRMLELRALTSLCALWQAAGSQDQLAAARRTLQANYDRFTEGFSGYDLTAARTQLAESAAR